jgi:hypothetical protein
MKTTSEAGPAALGVERGEEVEVLRLAEIRATLDERGMLDGMPFMPEMERFAGRKARVWRRADRVCVEGTSTMRGLRDTVFLEELRCDGAAHAGCQRACLLMWKEAWLRRPAAVPHEPPPAPSASAAAPPSLKEDGSFFCQSTELFAASAPLPSWRPGQYLRDLATGNLTVPELVRAFYATLGYKASKLLSRRSRSARAPRTPSERLGLVPGDWVEVKSLAEIEDTLDAKQMNKGLEFSPGMSDYCGRRMRVRQRLERVILEATGKMRDLRDTVLLENAYCDGACSRGCPRSSQLYWREIWLRRIAAPK